MIKRMQLVYHKIGVLCFLLCLTVSVQAQTRVSCTASVDKPEIGLNEYAEIIFRIENAEVESFTPPNFANFKIAGGPNQSNSVQIINGEVSKSRSYSYFLAPKSVGKFTIPPASIRANKKTFTTNPVTITVAKESKNAPPPVTNIAPPSSLKPSTTKDALSKNIFLKATINKQSAYKGELLQVTYKLYSRVATGGKQILQLPDFEGFYAVDKENPSLTTTEMYGNTRYNVQVIREFTLYPQHTGTLTIEPLAMQAEIIQENANVDPNDFFASFFNSNTVIPYNFQSNPIEINVKELPPNPPANFSGAVGNYTLTRNPSPTNISTDDALRVDILISGIGDSKQITAPTLTFDSTAFEIYEPKITEAIQENGTGTVLKKRFEYVLLPQKKGNFVIDPSFCFFNSQTNQYQTLHLDTLINTTIAQGKNAKMASKIVKDTLNQAVSLAPIKANFETHTARNFYGTSSFYLLLFAPFGLLLSFIGIEYWRKNRPIKDKELIRQQEADKIAISRLKKADFFLKKENARAFYDEISKALWGYVGDKFQLPPTEWKKETVSQKIQAATNSNDLAEEWVQLLDTCEMALFGGIDQPNTRHKLYTATNQWIKKAEQKLPRLK